MLGFAAMTSGCAKRLPLTPKELERVQTEAGVNPLRVYTERRMVALYDEAGVEQAYDVNRKIREGSDKEQEKVVTTRNTAGLILKIEELNSRPLLWVTFDATCKDPACAYGFVQTEDKRYRLITSPPMEGFAQARVYRHCVWKKRRLKHAKLSSLAEANEVYLVKKRNGKILTMELEVKKVLDNSTKTRTRRSRGID